MAKTYVDIQEGFDGELTGEGWRITRIAKVLNVEGTGVEKIYNAVHTSALPSIGDAFPPFTGAILTSIRPKRVDGTTVELELLYTTYQGTEKVYDFSSIATQQETNIDKDGNPIYLSYTYPTDYLTDPAWRGRTEIISASFYKMIPESVFRVTKSEGIIMTIVQERRKKYIGKVNEAGWELDPSAIAGSWLCSEIRAVKTGTSFYQMTYGFRYKQPFTYNGVSYPGWATQLIYEDPNTGKPPDPSTWTADTFKISMEYEYENFNLLNL